MSKQIVAMILAGGKGTHSTSSKKNAKPAVFFGGNIALLTM